MEKINWQVILDNIREAKEELQGLENKINSSEELDEVDLELSLRHAYHHLNSAWNIRNIETKRYLQLTKSEFEEWGKFPPGFDTLEMFRTEK